MFRITAVWCTATRWHGEKNRLSVQAHLTQVEIHIGPFLDWVKQQQSLCDGGDAGLCSKTKQLQVSSSSSQLGEEEKQLLAEDCSLSHKSALKCLMNCELWRGVLPLGDTPGSLLTQTLVIVLSCVSSTPRFPGIFLLTCYRMYPEYFQISWSTNGVKSTENVKRAWNQPCDV